MKKKLFCKTGLEKIFPLYKMEDLYPSPENIGDPIPKPKHNYKHLSVSVFDHWLTESEFEEKMITFCSFNCVPKRLTKLWTVYQRYEELLLKFYREVYKYYPKMLFKDKYIIKFNGKKEYMRYCQYNIREKSAYSFFVPNLGVIITGGWNLTQHILYAEEIYKKEKFTKMVTDAGLFILE